MISLRIDTISVQTEENISVLKAALAAGIPLTHLCADEISGVKGNCGLCLVEIEGREGLFRACETLVEDGMNVLTDTPAVRQAIKVRAARLFAAHPADCSACSKTGGCVIQKICAKYRPGLASMQRTGRKRK